MTDMEKVKIHGVPETMLQTLFARADHSQKKEHKFYDRIDINRHSVLS